MNPNYTHWIPNVSPRLIFGEAYIRKDIWVSIHGSLYSGAYIRKDIWVSIQRGLYSGGLYSGDLYSGAYIRDFTVIRMRAHYYRPIMRGRKATQSAPRLLKNRRIRRTWWQCMIDLMTYFQIWVSVKKISSLQKKIFAIFFYIIWNKQIFNDWKYCKWSKPFKPTLQLCKESHQIQFTPY